MLLAPYLPRLTVTEAERCWMQPLDVCELAMIGEEHRPETRKFLANVSDRGHVDFVRSGGGRTSPKLYSLKSAIMLKVFREMTDLQHSYEFAYPIAQKVCETAMGMIGTFDDPHQIEEDDWIVVFRADRKGAPGNIKILRRETLTAGGVLNVLGPAGGFIVAGFICFNIFRRYGEYWARERIRTGADPGGRYDGCDDNGRPLDPAHTWNASLPPLERARRLVEIEEFIARRDAGGHKK